MPGPTLLRVEDYLRLHVPSKPSSLQLLTRAVESFSPDTDTFMCCLPGDLRLGFDSVRVETGNLSRTLKLPTIPLSRFRGNGELLS